MRNWKYRESRRLCFKDLCKIKESEQQQNNMIEYLTNIKNANNFYEVSGEIGYIGTKY